MVHLQYLRRTLRYFGRTLVYFACTLKSFILAPQTRSRPTACGRKRSYKPLGTNRLRPRRVVVDSQGRGQNRPSFYPSASLYIEGVKTLFRRTEIGDRWGAGPVPTGLASLQGIRVRSSRAGEPDSTSITATNSIYEHVRSNPGEHLGRTPDQSPTSSTCNRCAKYWGQGDPQCRARRLGTHKWPGDRGRSDCEEWATA